MKLTALPRKIIHGLPYLGKELRAAVSNHTPFFIGRPRVVHIWRGAPCNGRCIMCSLGFAEGAERQALCHSGFTDEMLTHSLPQIAELCGRGTMISYMGGEPTLSPHLLDWVRIASGLGLDFRFTTNGYRFTQELAGQLVTAGLFNIGVSLESLDPKINETMRPYPDGTALTVRAIELLLSERRRQRARLSVNIKTVISNLNLDSFIEIARRWGREDGVLVTPQAFEAQPGMAQSTKDLLFIKDLRQAETFVEHISQLKREGYNLNITEQGLADMIRLCQAGAEHTATMHDKALRMDASAPPCTIATDNLWIIDGSVRICPYFSDLGNLVAGTTTLKRLWNSADCRQMRKDTRACRRLCNISCLRRTSLWHKVRAFLKMS